MSSLEVARNVHLVGTVPMADTGEVFAKVAARLAPFLKRVPDGETGVRHYWITSQARVLHYHPLFEPADHNWSPETGAPPPAGAPKYRLKPGVDAGAVELPSFGYGAFARASYQEFRKAKAAGMIAADTRFQVCLPTPLAFMLGIVAPECREAIGPAMERRVAGELADVCAAVLVEELAIQWDVCLEIYVWEGIRDTYFADPKAGCIERLIALGDLVPRSVELGYHFCYGDFKHAHAVEPKDMQNMVTMANAIAAGLRRPVSWWHMPVPRDRDDAAYFAPARGLNDSPGTELYLGLVHHTDAEPGTLRRMTAADRCLDRPYGISTECGWGRRDKATIPRLVDIHVQCARGIAA
jgi:hypothetical protein